MNKVLISYSRKDQELAKQLSYKLEHYNIVSLLDEFDIGYGYNFDKVFGKLDAGDFWVIILSSYSLPNRNIYKDFDTKSKKQLHNRNVSIIPLLVSGRQVPVEFKDRKIFNIKKDPEKDLDKVTHYLRNVPNVDFNSLNPQNFRDLVFALLKNLHFKNIEKEKKISDYRYDITATTTYHDPFGNARDLNWLIEIKFYTESRADIQSLRQLSRYLINLPPNYNGILITNSQLTSTAKDWLQENERSERIRITIVDGVQLREILLKYEDLVEKYFGSQGY